MKEQIKDKARQLGFDECRVTTAAAAETGPRFQAWLAEKRHGEMVYMERNAAKRLEPQLVLPEAKSVIALAVSYHTTEQWSNGVLEYCRRQSNPNTPILHHSNSPLAGQLARYAQFADYHGVLGQRLQELAKVVNSLGGAGTRSLWYADTGPVLERDFAQRAGVGFIGKHTNLISRKLGNWLFLAEIVTTLELPPDEAEKNRCGACTRCLAACPTQAIIAPFQLDARRCISYLTVELKGSIPVELRPAIGNRIYGCDECLAACPWNRFARAGQMMEAHARRDLSQPDLLELLGLDETGFKNRFAGTPMLRAKRRGLLRNVCVALGNVGDESALPALAKARQDSEPLIAEHARWAVEQIRGRSRKV